jgi:putative ABC transport system ATP-binding protein
MTAIVELKDVDKEYPMGEVTVRALVDIELAFEAGEFATVAGPSGSGKTTLLNLVGCIDVPTRGDVLIDGRSTSGLSDRELTALRRQKLGFIFQAFNLIDVLDVFRNVEFPLLLQGELSKAGRRERVEEMVEQVELTDQIHHRPGELSGGQRQRVAIARALVSRPAIVLADEPTANLDSGTGGRIIELMHEINRTAETTFIFSSHDPAIIERGDRVVRLADGRIDADTAAPAPGEAPDREVRP